MSERVSTIAGPFLVQAESDYQKGSGTGTTYTYEGTRLECYAQRNLERYRGASKIIVRQKSEAVWTCESFYPYGENGDVDPPVNTHELEINTYQPSVFNSPYLLATTLGGSVAKLSAVMRVFKKWQRGDIQNTESPPGTVTVKAEDKAEAEVNAATGSDAACLALFRQAAFMGMETFEEERTVYRRVVTVATAQQGKTLFTDEGKIWTTTEVETFEKISADWFFAIPAGKVWLKSRPRVVAAANQRVQMSYSYTEATAASSLVYAKRGAALTSNYLYYSP